VLHMTPSGQITQAQGLPAGSPAELPGMNLQHLYTGGVVLPDRAVAPGESWSSKSATPVPMPNGQTTQLQTNVTNTLKSVTAQGTHKIAIIETSGTVGMAGQRGLNESFTSTTRFDASSGVALSSSLQMKVAMDLGAQAAGAPNPPAGGFPPSTMTGTIKITTGPVPITSARPAGKAPARRTGRRR